MTPYPQGKGMFIYDTGALYRADIDQLVQASKDLKLSWASLKVADGGNVFEAGPVNAAVTVLRQAGLQVYGWHYLYGHDPIGESNRSAERILTLQLNGLMLDAEGEFDQPGRGPAATTYINNLGRLVGGTDKVGIGLNSFRYQTVHRAFPWQEFLAGCSFHMPQAYWEFDDRPTGPVEQLARSFKELTALRPLPFIPLGVACQDNGWKPTPQQVASFNQAALALKMPGVGWYEWNAALRQPELFLAVTNANGWEPASAPAPVSGVSQAVIDAYYDNEQKMLQDLQQGQQGTYSAWKGL